MERARKVKGRSRRRKSMGLQSWYKVRRIVAFILSFAMVMSSAGGPTVTALAGEETADREEFRIHVEDIQAAVEKALSEGNAVAEEDALEIAAKNKRLAKEYKALLDADGTLFEIFPEMETVKDVYGIELRVFLRLEEDAEQGSLLFLFVNVGEETVKGRLNIDGKVSAYTTVKPYDEVFDEEAEEKAVYVSDIVGPDKADAADADGKTDDVSKAESDNADGKTEDGAETEAGETDDKKDDGSEAEADEIDSKADDGSETEAGETDSKVDDGSETGVDGTAAVDGGGQGSEDASQTDKGDKTEDPAPADDRDGADDQVAFSVTGRAVRIDSPAGPDALGQASPALAISWNEIRVVSAAHTELDGAKEALDAPEVEGAADPEGEEPGQEPGAADEGAAEEEREEELEQASPEQEVPEQKDDAEKGAEAPADGIEEDPGKEEPKEAALDKGAETVVMPGTADDMSDEGEPKEEGREGAETPKGSKVEAAADEGEDESLGEEEEEALEEDLFEKNGTLKGRVYGLAALEGCMTVKAFAVSLSELGIELADLKKESHTIIYTIDPAGAATLVKAPEQAADGEPVIFGVQPEAGHEIVEVTANGEVLELAGEEEAGTEETGSEETGADIEKEASDRLDADPAVSYYRIPEVVEDQVVTVFMSRIEAVLEPFEETAKVDGVSITVTAKKGLPEGTRLVVEKADALEEKIQEEIGGLDAETGTVKEAIDIFAYHVDLQIDGMSLDDASIEEGDVYVTFSGRTIEEAAEKSDDVEIFVGQIEELSAVDPDREVDQDTKADQDEEVEQDKEAEQGEDGGAEPAAGDLGEDKETVSITMSLNQFRRVAAPAEGAVERASDERSAEVPAVPIVAAFCALGGAGYPEFEAKGTIGVGEDAITVTVSAEAGVVPAGTMLKAAYKKLEDKEAETVKSAIETLKKAEWGKLDQGSENSFPLAAGYTYELSLVNAEGKEIELTLNDPRITVAFSGGKIKTNIANVGVYDTTNSAEVSLLDTAKTEEGISFETSLVKNTGAVAFWEYDSKGVIEVSFHVNSEFDGYWIDPRGVKRSDVPTAKFQHVEDQIGLSGDEKNTYWVYKLVDDPEGILDPKTFVGMKNVGDHTATFVGWTTQVYRQTISRRGKAFTSSGEAKKIDLDENGKAMLYVLGVPEEDRKEVPELTNYVPEIWASYDSPQFGTAPQELLSNAADGEQNTDDLKEGGSGDPVDEEKKDVVAHKDAEWADYKEAVGKILLKVTGKKRPVNADVVIVLDKTGSMTPRYCLRQWDVKYAAEERMIPAKYAALEAVHTLLDDPTDNNRVAFTSFYEFTHEGGQVPLRTNEGIDALICAIKAVDGDEPQTYYENGIVAAKAYLDARMEEEKKNRKAYVIFISDGAPNGGHEGTEQAQSLREKDGVTIYAAGINATAGAEAALKALTGADDRYFAIDKVEDMGSKLNEIVSKIQYLGTGAEFVDTISEYYDLVDPRDLSGNDKEKFERILRENGDDPQAYEKWFTDNTFTVDDKKVRIKVGDVTDDTKGY